jgi:murein DD-endopeptidase MepM/ murein hydrolase activator NlpD
MALVRITNFFLPILFLISLSRISGQLKNYIEQARLNFKTAFIETEPESTVSSWKIPFEAPDRYKLSSITVISIFGAPRTSYLNGHIHSGADIIPAKTDNYIYVYPMADGVVCSIHLGHPHKTIVIKHKLSDGTIIYTSYKHLQEIYVENGTQVNQDTKLARLYTKTEAENQGGSYDHLHLEIRKSFEDYGCASWLTMTKLELNKYFHDPLDFMKKNLGEPENQ